MATIGESVVTLADVAKSLDPDGRIARVIELLTQTNRVLDDMHWGEANGPLSHRVTVRTGLPTSFWRLANQGTSISKGTKAQFNEGIGILEQWNEVDEVVADLNGNTQEFRLTEAKASIESMNQEKVQTLFYGNTGTAPEEFLGLSVRYNALTGAGNSQNVISGGGSGSDNLSIWLIGWGPQAVYGIYPKGSPAGLMHEDLGKVTVQSGLAPGNGRFRAYQDHFMWKCGLAVADWRYAVRICNIDVSDLSADKSTGANLADLMIQAYHRIPFPESVRLGFYMNRTAFQMLHRQRREDAIGGTGITMQDIDGRLMPTFEYSGTPIRIVDQLTVSEATVA